MIALRKMKIIKWTDEGIDVMLHNKNGGLFKSISEKS